MHINLVNWGHFLTDAQGAQEFKERNSHCAIGKRPPCLGWWKFRTKLPLHQQKTTWKTTKDNLKGHIQLIFNGSMKIKNLIYSHTATLTIDIFCSFSHHILYVFLTEQVILRYCFPHYGEKSSLIARNLPFFSTLVNPSHLQFAGIWLYKNGMNTLIPKLLTPDGTDDGITSLHKQVCTKTYKRIGWVISFFIPN